MNRIPIPDREPDFMSDMIGDGYHKFWITSYYSENDMSVLYYSTKFTSNLYNGVSEMRILDGHIQYRHIPYEEVNWIKWHGAKDREQRFLDVLRMNVCKIDAILLGESNDS